MLPITKKACRKVDGSRIVLDDHLAEEYKSLLGIHHPPQHASRLQLDDTIHRVG